MRISNISFQGIKVTKKQQNITSSQEYRAEQKRILADCYEQLASLDERANAVGADFAIDKNAYTSHERFYPKNSDWWTNGKDTYDKKREELAKMASILDEKESYSARMVKMIRDAFDKIIELDNLDARLLATQYITSYAFPKSIGIEKIAGYNSELGVLQREFIDRVNVEKLGQDVDIFGSILFFGPYGNGKTHITKSVAEATGCNIVKVRHTAKSSDEKTMKKIIEFAEIGEERFKADRTRTIIFIDEVDKIIGKNSTVSKEFEEFIKECSDKYHCSVFATTNNPLDLSVDMSDPDVFPIKMSIDPPNDENMEKIFKYYLNGMHIEGVDYQKIVETAKKRENETDAKYSVGQIKNICKALYENSYGQKLTQDDVIGAVLSSNPELTSDMNSKFENDYNELIER